MKNTKPRKIVLDIVNNSDSHLDAFGVYKLARMSIPNISLGTCLLYTSDAADE